jgi:hypothetical protein
MGRKPPLTIFEGEHLVLTIVTLRSAEPYTAIDLPPFLRKTVVDFRIIARVALNLMFGCSRDGAG